MAEVIRINDSTYRIEDNGVRFFVLEGSECALMIDSGMNTPDALDIAKTITQKNIKLLNTHTDRDHISGNGKFSEIMMSPTEWEWYTKANKTDASPVFVSDGSVIDLGNRELHIISLPGHTYGSIAVLEKDARVLYGGDSIQDGRIFMFGETRNFDLYISSLELLMEKHSGEFDYVYPSHSSLPVSPSIIPQLISAANDIRSGNADGHIVGFGGKKIRVCDFGFASFLCEPEK